MEMSKSKYYTHVEKKLELIRSWRESGLTERQIAEKLNIVYSTLQKYKTLHEDLTVVLQASKAKLVANLKKSLWQEAIGYEYTEVQESSVIIDGKEIGKKKRTKTTKKMRGVPNLLVFALCNMAPEEFKRVDKEVIKELEDKIDEKFRLENSIFQKEFEKLFPKKNGNKENI
jgi:hypothetical protein